MLYQSALALLEAGSSADIKKNYETYIGNAVHVVMPTGRLDLYLMKSPSNLFELERILSALYNIAEKAAVHQKKEHLNITVLVDGLDIDLIRAQQWDVILACKYEQQLPKVLRALVPDTHDIHAISVVILGAGDPLRDAAVDGAILEHPDEAAAVVTGTDEHNIVAVGGTFDHLHVGHKILLTVAGYIAREYLIVGITGPELLKNKKYAEAMESYAQRKQSVETFLNYVYPSLALNIVMINDVYGPTGTQEDVDALVVSAETAAGAVQINNFRKDKGWHELKVYQIQLIPDEAIGEKVSSTELRRRALEERKTASTSSPVQDDGSKL